MSARPRNGGLPFASEDDRVAAKGKSADAGADAAAADDAAAPKGGRKKLILIVAGALLALGAAGGGYAWFSKRAPAEATAAAKPDAKKVVAFVDLRDMTINLIKDPQAERASFLRIKAALEVADGKLVPDIQPLLPRVEDTFQVYMRELRASDLDGSVGIHRLREELLKRVNIAVHPAKVDAVLFKELLVQ